ncbi:hypothetical protein C2E25_12975 [Geothermobacter hydrogeniphilus]|uniref:Uncharacterized protein n=1 Tax=Geothermobacter hydrogeniphilus TaxID=1969733 RepID=A0A2K2H7T0_9BACT|nr:hypothetical protein [Geothermobacter hydrogeniphilus]PNU19317.1 hypothetical protein C2E25_12975 [Geothermobacter hydrogeniphilus]
MTEEKSKHSTDDTAPPEETERYPELAELQREIDRRIRDNQKFLDHFLDEDFPDEEDDAPTEEEPFPEL